MAEAVALGIVVKEEERDAAVDPDLMNAQRETGISVTKNRSNLELSDTQNRTNLNALIVNESPVANSTAVRQSHNVGIRQRRFQHFHRGPRSVASQGRLCRRGLNGTQRHLQQQP
jgi:hypothetical protein